MRTRNVLVIGVLALAVLGAGALWFVNRDSPDTVDIDRAIADAVSSTPEDEEGIATAADEELTDVSGTWAVITDLVPFDSATGSGSWVGYRIDEELSGVGAFTAVGRSPRVEGSIVIVDDLVTQADIRADLVGLVSDNANRDARVRPLFTDRPVSFVLSEPVAFGALPEPGQRVTVTAMGVLRIGDIEQDVSVELSADVVGSRLVVTGSTVVTLADFDVRVPSAPVVLGVSDVATIELQLYLARG